MAFADRPISEFLERIASATVTPSGGAAAAIGGATGTALCEMVCIHTDGKDGYADVERELADARSELRTHRLRLLELGDEDSAAVDALQDAFETREEGRDEAVQQAAKRATEVPMETAEECLAVVERATAVTENGNRNAIADAGTGALLAHAALEASVLTVRLNVELIADTAFVAEMNSRATEIDDSAAKAIERVTAACHDAR